MAVVGEARSHKCGSSRHFILKKLFELSTCLFSSPFFSIFFVIFPLHPLLIRQPQASDYQYHYIPYLDYIFFSLVSSFLKISIHIFVLDFNITLVAAIVIAYTFISLAFHSIFLLIYAVSIKDVRDHCSPQFPVSS